MKKLKINVPIPDGMVLKSVRSEVKNDVIVVIPEYEEKPKYKDGDILTLKSGEVFIYNSDNSKIANSCGNNYYVLPPKKRNNVYLTFSLKTGINGMLKRGR